MIRTLKRFIHRAMHLMPGTQSLMYRLGGTFTYEIRAVVAGTRCFYNGSDRAVSSGIYTLRRNIHRLEKGLISQPRREVFALEYIEPTVAAYVRLSEMVCDTDQEPGSIDVLQWASDVLDSYFSVVSINSNVKLIRCHQIYSTSRSKYPRSPRGFTPFQRPPANHGISFERFKKFSDYRRSCRWYLPQRVPRDVIDRAMDVARNSPSACNRQPFVFHIFDDPQKAAEVGGIPMGTRGFSQNFPCFIAIVGDLSAFPFPRDRHVIYIDASLAAMSFQYALELQGVGSCCINWPEISRLDRKMSERLGLLSHQRVVMCLSIGYPDPEASVPYSQKKTVDELRTYRT